MCEPQVMSDDEILKVLDEVGEQYRDYTEIEDIRAITRICVLEDYSTRDMSHPLGFIWQGRGNGVVE